MRVTRDGATLRIDRPGYLLRETDVVSFLIGERLVRYAVIGFADRRGPPASAALIAEDLDQKHEPTPCKAAG